MPREFLGIGIDEYRDARYNKLDRAISDASSLRGFFAFGLPTEYCFDRTELLSNPLARDVTTYLEDALTRLDEDSVFVFYFAGHGLFRRDFNQQLLLCRDALGVLADGYDGTGAITLDFMRYFSQRGKGNMFFCFDACRREVQAEGGRASDAGGANGFRFATSERPDANLGGSGLRWSLQSCGAGQLAKDDGSFVKALIAEMSETLSQGRDLTLGSELVEGITRRLGSANQRPEASGAPFLLASGANYRGRASVVSSAEQRGSTRRAFPSPSRAAGTRKTLTIADGATIAFRWAPPGRFLMGSPRSEEGRNDEETQHEVELTKGFWLAETQTTQEAWNAIMRRNPSCFKGDLMLPVENASWNDCQEFIAKLNGLTLPGAGVFRLPTEAEWEYACRAGTQTAYPWGNALNGDKANCNGKYPYGTTKRGNFLNKTSRVGQYGANAWGLFNMIGNVWEWCADARAPYPKGTVVDPQGATFGDERVVRGGSWFTPAKLCRAATRFGYAQSTRSAYVGFRLATSDPEQ